MTTNMLDVGGQHIDYRVETGEYVSGEHIGLHSQPGRFAHTDFKRMLIEES